MKHEPDDDPETSSTLSVMEGSKSRQPPLFLTDDEAGVWRHFVLHERTAYEYPPAVEASVKTADFLLLAYRQRCADLLEKDLAEETEEEDDDDVDEEV